MTSSEEVKRLIQSALYHKEIKRVIRAFQINGLNLVILKGLPLYLFYDGSLPKRTYVDCDILVNIQYSSCAENFFLTLGYKKLNDSFMAGHHSQLEKEKKQNYYKIIRGVPIVFDIHFEVAFMMTQLGGLDALYPQKLISRLTEECLKTTRKITFNGESSQILDPKHLILYLALHFFHHNYRGVFRLEFMDKVIRKVIRRRKFNTDLINQLIKSARIYRLQNFIYPTFILLIKYFKTPIPQILLEGLKPKEPLVRAYISSLTKADISEAEPRMNAGVIRFINLYILSPESFWKKMIIFLHPHVFRIIFWVFREKLFFSLLNQK
ncbi:nucleotidyltransferase family protein [Candidatus Roizmanbacteria bacterium]|nr:nucleotidyltransferase family protein [Candidatus Roizmanbacteria bacterium]